ncbi:MAG: pectin esterase, partial [Duncaniella sp.]|nr:pectin esterase [Duncaniella sp.]
MICKKLLFPAIAMLMAPTAFAAGPYHAVVAQDGTGDYKTVSEAIEAAPEGRTAPWLILVKKGVYDELPVIPAAKTNIHLIGQDRSNTVITHRINQGGKPQDQPRYN